MWTVAEPTATLFVIRAPPLPRILHEDDRLIIVDKPPGMLTHANRHARGTRDCVSVLSGSHGRRVHAVHRLDRLTSGLLVLAKDKEAARYLGLQFSGGDVRKIYHALVRGWPPDGFCLDEDIRDHADGIPRSAWTGFTTVSRAALRLPDGRNPELRFALVAAEPGTGRRQQIRKHLQYASFPILGDKRHGDRTYNALAAAWFGPDLMFLRAVGIGFRHPGSGQWMEPRLEPDPVWVDALVWLGLPPAEPAPRIAGPSG